MSGFAASPKQRAKVYGGICAICYRSPVDPAHLTARAQGGCDHPDCVIPLCRSCHRLFDERELNLEPILAMSDFAAERAHMAGHLSFAQCIRRLNPERSTA